MASYRKSALKMESTSDKLIVAAMDFGTTFSGYAYSFRHSPLDIGTNPSWVAGTAALISLKNPTVVLLNPDKSFHSFGFAAESKYAALCEEDEHHDWYLFRRFKMALYQKKTLNLQTTIDDISGKSMPAITIFSHAIKFLKDHLLGTLQMKATDITNDDINYVITVPAIWDERAKVFMRKAAISAGINHKQIRFALEPEAASIWCQVLTDDQVLKLSEVGTKYMVVDLGGGTADITVHEKLAAGELRELHRASGGAWGGSKVDQAFLDMLTKLVGVDVMQSFKLNNMEDYLEMVTDLETRKRSLTCNLEGKMTLRLPLAFTDCCKEKNINFQDEVDKSEWKGRIKLQQDKLRVDKNVVRGFFDAPLKSIIDHVKGLFAAQSLKDVGLILLVGGFSESEIVQNEFRTSFPEKSLLIPKDPGTVVLKGAVRFGHLPEIIQSRVARFSFGREGWPEFNEKEHDCKRKTKYLGKDVCKEVFWTMVKMGDELPYGKTVSEVIPGSVGQEGAHINIFCSADSMTKYVSDESCNFLGELLIPLPESDNPKDKDIELSFIFGDTELKVKVKILKTKEEFEKTIDI